MNRAQIKYQCTACAVYFDLQEDHRNHYKTQWHSFNLMRKTVDKDAIRLDQYNLLVDMESKKDTFNGKSNCYVCHKNFVSKNAFENHLKSKKHIMNDKRSLKNDKPVEHVEKTDIVLNSLLDACFFCSAIFPDFNQYVVHLKKKHSFIPPDQDKLTDPKGFYKLLSQLVHLEFQCILCCKQFSSSYAVKDHMEVTGHKTIPFESVEDCQVFSSFYCNGICQTQVVEYYTDDEAADNEDDCELVLPSGALLGHRKYKVYYNQKETLPAWKQSHSMVPVFKKDEKNWITTSKQAMKQQKNEWQHLSRRQLHISRQMNNQKHFFDPNSLCQ